jgi:hypothetical protein
MSSLHELPPLYGRWVGEVLGAGIPRETRATCEDCAMCVKPDGTLPTATYFFDRAVKCCVYLPELASFLVGRILADDDPDPRAVAGRASVRARIAQPGMATPVGLRRPPSYDLVYRNSAETLGRSLTLRCPHYVEDGGGQCGIWKHRDAVCTTFFCKFVRGKVGSDQWRAIQELLEAVEGALARHFALELGIDVEVVGHFTPREGKCASRPAPTGLQIDGNADPALLAWMWGPWRGREEDFYRECGARASTLSWADVRAVGGSDLAVLEGIARRAFERATSDLLPARLRLGTVQLAAPRDGGVRAVTYSVTDAIDLPTALLPLLPLFDGRETLEILKDLLENHGVGLEPPFLRALVDWGVLVGV